MKERERQTRRMTLLAKYILRVHIIVLVFLQQAQDLKVRILLYKKAALDSKNSGDKASAIRYMQCIFSTRSTFLS